MAIRRMPRSHTTGFARRSFLGASQTLGEACVVFQMRHASVTPSATRCACFNPVYDQNEASSCPDCYGTTFADPILGLYRTWGIFQQSTRDESFTNRGEYTPNDMDFQIEPHPPIFQHDYLVRIMSWDSGHHVVQIEDFYRVNRAVTPAFIRSGAQYGGVDDEIAQTGRVLAVPSTHIIRTYPLLSAYVPRLSNA